MHSHIPEVKDYKGSHSKHDQKDRQQDLEHSNRHCHNILCRKILDSLIMLAAFCFLRLFFCLNLLGKLLRISLSQCILADLFYILINLLKDLQDEYKLTYLFISHDLSVVKFISDEVGVMYLGELVEIGSKEQIFDHFCHPYTQALLSAAPSFDPRKRNNDKRIILQGDLPSPANPPSGCRFHTRCPYATERCAKEVPQVYEVEPGHKVRCHFAMDYAKKGF